MNRLERKLEDNARRRKFGELLACFKGDLHDALANAECLSSERIASLIEHWHWSGDRRCADEPNERPPGWQYTDYDNTDALFRHACLTRMPATDACLWLSNEAPVLLVNGDLWNSFCFDLLGYAKLCPNMQLAMVSSDNARGILLTEYVGRLPKPRRTNMHEVIYEMVTW